MYQEVFLNIRGRKYRKCYQDLDWAVEVVAQSKNRDWSMNEIADAIGEKTGKARSSVLKSLSRAVDDIWDTGDRAALQEIYQFHLHEKPTPKELVMHLASYQKKAVEYQLYEDEEKGLCIIAMNPVLHSVYAIVPVDQIVLSFEQLVCFLNRIQASVDAVCELICKEEPE